MKPNLCDRSNHATDLKGLPHMPPDVLEALSSRQKGEEDEHLTAEQERRADRRIAVLKEMLKRRHMKQRVAEGARSNKEYKATARSRVLSRQGGNPKGE